MVRGDPYILMPKSRFGPAVREKHVLFVGILENAPQPAWACGPPGIYYIETTLTPDSYLSLWNRLIFHILKRSGRSARPDRDAQPHDPPVCRAGCPGIRGVCATEEAGY